MLKPDGRVSLFEPINRRFAALNQETLFGFEVAPVADLAVRVRAVFEAAAPPDGAMMGFDETDLLHLAESAGFSDVNVTLELSTSILSPFTLSSWDQVMMTRPNPNAPSYGEAIQHALTGDEAQRLEGHLRPLIESGAESRNRAALAYLKATKPSD